MENGNYEKYKITIDFNDSQQRIDRFINKMLKINHSYICKLIRSGKIKINGKNAKINYILKECDEVKIEYWRQSESHNNTKKDHSKYEKYRDQLESIIIYENENFFCINKPSGIATQGGSRVNYSLDEMFQYFYGESFLVHRLDKETSGVMLIARNLPTARAFAKLFAEKLIKKTYILVTEKVNWKKKTVDNVPEGESNDKQWITEFKKLRDVGNYSLLEANPLTGRKHQIRIHCACMLKPIIGDRLYGNKKNKYDGSLLLHSKSISFIFDNYSYEFDVPCNRINEFLVINEEYFPN